MEAFWVSALLGIDAEAHGTRKEISDLDLSTVTHHGDDSIDHGYDSVGIIAQLEKIFCDTKIDYEIQIQNISDANKGEYVDFGVGFIPAESIGDGKVAIEEIDAQLVSWKDRIEKAIKHDFCIFFRKDPEGWIKGVDNVESREAFVDSTLRKILDSSELLKQQYREIERDLRTQAYPNEDLSARTVEVRSLVYPERIRDVVLSSAFLANEKMSREKFLQEVFLLFSKGMISEKSKREFENIAANNIIIYTDVMPSCDLFALVLGIERLLKAKISLSISVVPNPFVFLGSKRLTVRSVANSLGLISRPPGAESRLRDILKSFLFFDEVSFSYAFENADRSVDAFSYIIMESARLCFYGTNVKFLFLDCLRKLFEFYASSLIVQFTGDSLILISGRERVVFNEGEQVQRIDGIFLDITPSNNFIDRVVKSFKIARMDAEMGSFLVGFRSFLNFLNAVKGLNEYRINISTFLKVSVLDLISVVTSQITINMDREIDFSYRQKLAASFFRFYKMYKKLSLVPLAARFRMLDATAMVIPKRLFLMYPNFEKYFKLYAIVHDFGKIKPGHFYRFIKQMDRSNKPFYFGYEDVVPQALHEKYVVIGKSNVMRYKIFGNAYVYTNIIFKKYTGASHVFPTEKTAFFRFFQQKLLNEEEIYYASNDIEFKEVDRIYDYSKKDVGQNTIENFLQIKPVAWFHIRRESDELHPEDLIRSSIYVRIAIDMHMESLGSILGLRKHFFAIESGLGAAYY